MDPGGQRLRPYLVRSIGGSHSDWLGYRRYVLLQVVSTETLLTCHIGGYTVRGTPTPISPDFENLSSQWAAASPSSIAASAYSPSLSPPPCPATTADAWLASGPLPMLNQEFNGASGASGASGSSGVTTGSGRSGSSATQTTYSSEAAAATKLAAPALLALLVAAVA